MKGMGLLAAGLLCLAGGAQAELVMSAAPREDMSTARQTYGPLAERIGQVLGEPVKLQLHDNWGTYGREMREGKYDIVFDGPHLAAWRMEHVGHRPVARLPGSLRYHVVSRKEDPAEALHSLRFAPVCAQDSPNLNAVSLLVQFDPVSAPSIVAPKGGMPAIYKGMFQGLCRAAVLRDQYYDTNLWDDDRKVLNVLHTSQAYPNQGFTAGPRLDDAALAKLRQFLLGNDDTLKPLYSRFGDKGTTALVPSDAAEIKGLHKLLEGVVWGW